MRFPRSIIPDAITLLSMALGFAAIARAVHGDFLLGSGLICLAGLLDVLDGRVATLLRATSEFGGELDSFADLVVFCCAPAVLVYVLYFESWGAGGIALGSLPILCGALRLTRFNLQEHESASSAYVGLPTPMAAGLLVGFVILTNSERGSGPLSVTAAGLTVLTSALMVSTIRFDTDQPFRPPAVLKRWRGFWLISFFPAAALFPRYAVFLWPAAFAGYGVLRWIYASLLPYGGSQAPRDTTPRADRLSPGPEPPSVGS